MDHWEKLNKTSSPVKENFCSHLNIKILLIQIIYMERVCKDLEINNLREYHDLHIQG